MKNKIIDEKYSISYLFIIICFIFKISISIGVHIFEIINYGN